MVGVGQVLSASHIRRIDAHKQVETTVRDRGQFVVSAGASFDKITSTEPSSFRFSLAVS